jgi:capsular exopolysaccharide synthesis family protein
MSKLYDALLKGKGGIPDLDPADLIGDQIDPVPAPVHTEAPPLVVRPIVPKAQDPVPAMNTGNLAERRRVHLRLPDHSPVLPFANDHWQANEQYRVIRTKIQHHIGQPKILLVSSAGPGDGKSTTAINLAGVLSLRAESSVLLVDGDFRKSAVHVKLGISEEPGLAEVLEGTCELQDAIVVAEELPNLHLMAAGKPNGNPAELLASSRWVSTATLLRSQFKYIVIDSPPVASVADYELLQTVCDGVVIVVRPDRTNRSTCHRVLESVPKNKLIGVVMNCVTEWFLGAGYGYGYDMPHYYRAVPKK